MIENYMHVFDADLGLDTMLWVLTQCVCVSS